MSLHKIGKINKLNTDRNNIKIVNKKKKGIKKFIPIRLIKKD
jgi:hypothetical protein